MEIERKFLVKSPPPGWRAKSGTAIRQGYFSLKGKETEIRLRQKANRHFITIKAGRGQSRLEEEIPMTRRQFESLWPLVCAASITKKRYKIPYKGCTIELDVYQGAQRGLRTAEVEFSSDRHSESFTPPEWLGREITGNRRYANERLARSGQYGKKS